MLAGAHKKSEHVQHTEIYLLGLKPRYKHKTKLPLDMVSKHVLLSIQHPNTFQGHNILPNICQFGFGINLCSK